MVFAGQVVIAVFATLLMLMAIVRIGIAAWLENKLLDGKVSFGSVEVALVFWTLLSGVVSFVSAIACFMHVSHFNSISRFGANAVVLLDFAFSFLAMGFAAKYWDTDISNEEKEGQKQTIAVLNIVTFLFTIILLSLVNAVRRGFAFLREPDLRTGAAAAPAIVKSPSCTWCNRRFNGGEQFCGSCGSVRGNINV
eukprot:m.159858 g.159858  ORF g.159858 m.159858 type:complete len:195 (-) comp17045_c1_seq3:1525-2109(-)